MEMKQLECFMAAAKYGSLSEAAKKLFLTQPAMSQNIKTLEQELNVILFQRTGKKLILTAAGNILLKYVTSAICCLNTARIKIADLQFGRSGVINIGSWHNSGMNILPDIIHAFHQQYPNLRFDIIQGEKEDLLARLDQSTLDLCFVRKNEQKKYAEICFPDDELVIVGSRLHLKNDSIGFLPISCLKHTPLIIKRNLSKRITSLCEKHNFTPNIFCCCDDTYTTIQLVTKGIGVTILPRSNLAVAFQSELIIKELEELVMHKACSLIYDPMRISPSAQLLIDFLNAYKKPQA